MKETVRHLNLQPKTRHALLGAVSIGALALFAPLPSYAQEEGASAGGFDEIIVSAQRREQSAQDVPISLKSFGGDAIDQQSISEAADYLALTPNVTFTQDGETGSRGVNISIRGVGDVDLGEVTVANSIGYYVDELSVGSVANGVARIAPLRLRYSELLLGVPFGLAFLMMPSLSSYAATKRAANISPIGTFTTPLRPQVSKLPYIPSSEA